MAQEEKKYCIVYTTVPHTEAAEKIIKNLLEQKYAACIQQTPIKSSYVWEGKVAEEAEILLSIKTLKSLYKAVEESILSAHTYQIPEIIAVDIEAVVSQYGQWMDSVL